MNVTGAIREGIFSNHTRQSKIWGQGMEGNGSRLYVGQCMYRTQISGHGNVYPMCLGGDSPFSKLCYCSVPLPGEHFTISSPLIRVSHVTCYCQ